jgi:hypothetical protein
MSPFAGLQLSQVDRSDANTDEPVHAVAQHPCCSPNLSLPALVQDYPQPGMVSLAAKDGYISGCRPFSV